MTDGGPARPDVAVSLRALESDAVRWTDAAADLRAAAAAAAGQVLDASAFSFAGREVATAYEALRSRTASLLTAGADNLDAVAAALRAGAAAYAADEAAAAARLRAADAGGPR
jgi:DNA-binding NarL/FixJ family response regulator